MQGFLKKLCFTIFLVLQTLILVSCGGGGSSSSSGGTSVPNNSTGGELTVKMISPSNTANAPLNTPIVLQFSAPVSNVSTSTVKLMENDPITGTQIGITTPTSGTNNTTYTFYSKNILSPNTKYYVMVDTGILSVSSNQSVVATNFTFTTGNFAAPIPTLVNPTDGDTGVSTSTNIQIQFNESVSGVSASTVLLHESDPTSKPISMTMSDIVESNTYTFTPETLKPGTVYYVEVVGEITSIATGTVVKDTTFNFTTSQTLKSPTVNILTPQNNQVIESLQPIMMVQFSESVSNVNTSTVILHAGSPTGESVAISMVGQLSHDVYEFKATNLLTAKTTYYLELTSEIKSVATGLPLVDTEFHFITQPPAFAYVLDINGVTACQLSTLTGDFTGNCNNTGFGKNSVSVRASLVNNAVYLVNQESGSISSCPIDALTGNIISCSDTAGFDKPSSIAITKDGKYAYITTISGDDAIWYCKVSESNQSLQNCDETGYPVNSDNNQLPLFFSDASSITLDPTNTYAYISDSKDNTVTSCTVSGDMNLTNCTELKNFFIVKPTGLSVGTNGVNLYMASDASDLLSSAIDPANGSLSAPDIVKSNFTQASDTASSNNTIYITDSGNGGVTMCYENEVSGKVYLCHFTKLNLVKAASITILQHLK